VPERPVEVVVSIEAIDVLAGRLYSHRGRGRESASFTYEADYLARADAYALDPNLPLVQGSQQAPVDLKMFRAFADAAPDRWGRSLVERAEKHRAERAGSSPRSLGEIDFLLGVRDDLRQGAIRFRDPDTGIFLATDDVGVPTLTDLPRLLSAAEHIERDEETDSELGELLRAGSSLGGARPKAHVIDPDGRIAIAKFPSARYDTWNVGAWEKVALDMAEAASIRVPSSRLLRLAERSVLIVDRFDRDGGRRIGYASAMTMLEARDHDTGSYLDIASVLELLSPQATADLQELWRRIAYTILISNTDDHLRNHGFLHVGTGAWVLSPAFDMNPNPAPGPKRLHNTIDGYDTAASISTLMGVCEYFRLTKPDALETLGEVVRATMQWREVATRLGLTKSEIEAMTPALEHDEADTARALVSG